MSPSGPPPDPAGTSGEPAAPEASEHEAPPQRRRGRFTARWRDLPAVEPDELSTCIWDDLTDWDEGEDPAAGGRHDDPSGREDSTPSGGPSAAAGVHQRPTQGDLSPPSGTIEELERSLLRQLSGQTARLERLEAEWRRVLREIGRGLAGVSAEIMRRLDSTLRTELGRVNRTLHDAVEASASAGAGPQSLRRLEHPLDDLRERTDLLGERLRELERRQQESLSAQRKALVAAATDAASGTTDETLRGLRKVEQRMQAHVAEAIGEIRGAQSATNRKLDEVARTLSEALERAIRASMEDVGARLAASTNGQDGPDVEALAERLRGDVERLLKGATAALRKDLGALRKRLEAVDDSTEQPRDRRSRAR